MNQSVVNMPAKKAVAKSKGKAKQVVSEADTEPPAASIDDTLEDGNRMEIEEKIADFFEGRSFFYNQSSCFIQRQYINERIIKTVHC